MTEWKWKGARWWKFDFHTHTPASDDYGSGPNQAALKSRAPKNWLLDFMRAGIDCVAITDHNTGAWIDQLKVALAELETERPDGFRAIYLFPGMEISVHGGIHVLAIFDASQSTADMDALRGAVEYAGTPGTSDAVTRKSFIEVYMGRSGPFLAAFNPWLNAVIGGRGRGKSTLVEFLRTALRRTDELPQALSPDFEKYARVYQSREDTGLLTSDSCFAVVYRKDATRYRVQWSERADAPPIEVETGAGVWALEQGEVGQRFPVRIYSQKQIFELAKAPLALLRIVDEAPEVDLRGWQERWRESETRFLSLRAKAREIDAGLSEEGQEGILGRLYGGAADSTGMEDRLAELKASVRAIAGGGYDPDMVRDQRFATHLAKLPPETFDRLEATQGIS